MGVSTTVMQQEPRRGCVMWLMAGNFCGVSACKHKVGSYWCEI